MTKLVTKVNGFEQSEHTGDAGAAQQIDSARISLLGTGSDDVTGRDNLRFLLPQAFTILVGESKTFNIPKSGFIYTVFKGDATNTAGNVIAQGNTDVNDMEDAMVRYDVDGSTANRVIVSLTRSLDGGQTCQLTVEAYS